MKRLIFAPLVLAACGGEEIAAPEPKTAVVQAMRLAKEEPNGVSAGFNLDGVASDTSDEGSCRQPDFVDPSGVPGIDNQLARLLPIVDLAGQGALEALLQGAINEGRLLVFFELYESEPGKIDVYARRGDDVPLLGTDGRILSGQTLALHEESELGAALGARVEGDQIIAGPFPLRLPVIVFSTLYDLKVQEAMVRFKVTPEGDLVDGVIGGGVLLTDLMDLVAIAEERGAGVMDVLVPVLNGQADMAFQNGACTKISLAATFNAVPAFVFE